MQITETDRIEKLQGPQGQRLSTPGPMKARQSRWRLCGGGTSRLRTRETVSDERRKKKKKMRVRGGALILIRRKWDRNQQNPCLAPCVRERGERRGRV